MKADLYLHCTPSVLKRDNCKIKKKSKNEPMNIKKSSLVIRNITLDLHRSSLNQSVELLRMKGQNSKSEEKNGGCFL